MSLLQDTLEATYAGVPFLVLSTRTPGGFKTVKHEYPNSDKQSIEQLGLIPHTFAVRAAITADAGGVNFASNRANFIRALQTPGKNILVHPLYGRLDNIKVENYTIIEDFTKLGEAIFEINFLVDNSEGIPVETLDTLARVGTVIEEGRNDILSELADSFFMPSTYPANYLSAIGKTQEVISAFNENTSFLQVSADKINTFSAELGDLEASIASIVNNPTALVDSINTLFSTVNGLYATAEATFEVLIQFFNFGETDTGPGVLNTQSKIENQANVEAFNFTIHVESLLSAYLAAAQIEYTTVEGINAVNTILEEQYRKVINASVITSSMKDTLHNSRVVLQRFFNQEKITAQEVIEVTSPQIPSRILAYQYYADADNDFSIAKLNSNLNTSFTGANVKVLTR